MTTDPDLEPWLPDGFPPPSFVVETERIDGVASARGRWMAAAAILGAVLLVASLILTTRGGGDDDEIALETAPETTTTTTLETLATFPGSTDLDPTSGSPDATTPPPTLPPAPGTSIFPTSSSTLKPSTPAPAPGTTKRPAPTPKPTSTSTTLPPTSSTTTTTTAPPKPFTITKVGGASTFSQGTPCTDLWGIRADVMDANAIDSVKVRFTSEPPPNEAPMDKDGANGDGQGTWKLGPQPMIAASATVTFEIVAKNVLGLEKVSEAETLTCPPSLS